MFARVTTRTDMKRLILILCLALAQAAVALFQPGTTKAFFAIIAIMVIYFYYFCGKSSCL